MAAGQANSTPTPGTVSARGDAVIGPKPVFSIICKPGNVKAQVPLPPTLSLFVYRDDHVHGGNLWGRHSGTLLNGQVI